MAKYIVFDKDLFGIDGNIPLFRKDDWTLRGEIVDGLGKCKRIFDLTGYSASAFFPAASGGPVSFPVNIVAPKAGRFELEVPGSASSGIALAEQGTSLYFTLDNSTDNITTVETPYEPLEIRDRYFREF